MDISNVTVSLNSLEFKVNVKDIVIESISPIYNIHCCEFQLKTICITNQHQSKSWYLLLKFKKCIEDGLKCIAKLNCLELKLQSKTFISDDSHWRVLGCYTKLISTFSLKIDLDYQTSSYFGCLVDDDSLTDFEIKGTDGSIRVHKVILAVVSDVFRQMITQDFNEKKEAQVVFPYPKCVLQDLKKYLYSNELNDDNVENLLLLAQCYMMHDLKQKCINRLLFNITTEKSLELIQFAVMNRITELLVAILKIVQEKKVDFENFEITLPICNGEGDLEIKQ